MTGGWLNVGDRLKVGDGLNDGDGLGEAEVDVIAGGVGLGAMTVAAAGLFTTVLTLGRGAARCEPVRTSSVTLATHTATTQADRITVAAAGRR